MTLAKAGDKVFWRNTGKEAFFSKDAQNYVHFVLGESKVASGGNVMSLVDKSCQSLTIPCDYCFSRLFYDCTSLVSAPELPATELAEACYFNMFNGCTSLESAPELPATELAIMCYLGIFSECENLKHVKVGFEEWGDEESRATYGWLSDVSPEGTFECPEGLEIKYGLHYIPEGWTVETR